MATRWKGTPAEVDALDAWVKLNRALDAIGRQLRRPLEDAGMTPGQFAVLEALYHTGAQSAGDLGRRVLRSQANMTTVLDNLERDGMVERQRDRADRRVVTIRLTPAGRRAIERVLPDHVAGITAALAALTPAEQHALARLCRKLGLAAAARTSPSR